MYLNICPLTTRAKEAKIKWRPIFSCITVHLRCHSADNQRFGDTLPYFFLSLFDVWDCRPFSVTLVTVYYYFAYFLQPYFKCPTSETLEFSLWINIYKLICGSLRMFWLYCRLNCIWVSLTSCSLFAWR